MTPLKPWLTIAMLAAATTAEAQIVRGGISGTIRDVQRLLVPGATVSAVDTATNAVRETVSDGQGFFRIGALDPGVYDVTIELSGFTRVPFSGVVVRAATDTSLEIELAPAGIGQEVTVLAERTVLPLDKSSPNIGLTIPQRMVAELPLPLGRDINELVLTAPNVSRSVGQGTYAVNGQRPRNNNHMIDGSDNNDISVTIPTSDIVPEAVAEFQVMTNPYSVEFGRNSGGQINVITRSGSNRFTGEAWEYWTGSRFFSLNNIEKASGLDKPATFNRHQVGGNLGGPVLRDRVFFFGLYQADAQRPEARPGVTTRIPTPAGFAALQSVPLRPAQSAASRQTVLQRISFLQDAYRQNPAFRNISSTPVNGVPIETGETNINIVDPSTYHYALARGDYRVGIADTVTVRYSLNHLEDKNHISNLQFGEAFAGNQLLIDTNLAASNTHVFSPTMLNEFRFSLVRRDLDFPENDPASPLARISGLFQIGGDANFPQGRLSNAYQFSNTVTWMRERHSFKFGADMRYNTLDSRSGFNTKGSFNFNSLQDFMNNSAFRFEQQLQSSSFEASQWQTFLFIQDDVRIRPDLTLNLGLRYERSEVPLGFFGARDPESLAVGVPGPPQDDRDNVAPRLGFAWSPNSTNRLLGAGRSVIRGGYGYAYDVVFWNLLFFPAANYPRVVNADVNNVIDVYPNLIPVTGQAIFSPLNSYTNASADLQNPESRFYSLSFQRELGDTHLVEIGYSGSRGYKGINQIIMNPAILTPEQAATVRAGGTIPSAQARRQNPQWGPRGQIPAYVGPGGNDAEARSEYNALFMSLGRRMSRGIQFNTSYTYSRWYSNNDEPLFGLGTDASSQRPQNMFDYEAEWARSNFDRPHRFVLSYIWEVPGPTAGLLRHVLGGWQLSGVTSGQSGRPFTILTGVDSNGDTNLFSDRPDINAAGSFVWDKHHREFTNTGYYVVPVGPNGLPLANSISGGGNAPRNTERYAAAWNTDISLMKRVQIASREVIFRVDAFNAFNQDDYNGARGTTISMIQGFNTMSSPSFGQNGLNWGRRSFQLSGKFRF
jgi:hypothetical protein